jgi:type I restriction enzyme S subunit
MSDRHGAAPSLVLSDVADLNRETLSVGSPPDHEFCYIDLGSVTRGVVDWASVARLNFATAPSRARRITRAHDVLFGTVRPALESHASIPADAKAGEFVASTGFVVLRAKPQKANARFLYHYCFSNLVRMAARRAEVGSNYPAVNESDVARFAFPAIPLAQQRRIAEMLDTADEAIRSSEHLITKLGQLRLGLLHDLVTPATAEAHPPLKGRRGAVRLDEVLDRIEAGWTPTSEDVAPRTGEWGVLKVSAVSGGSYNSSEAKRLAKGVRPRCDLEVMSGDVLLARANGVADLVATVTEVHATPPGLTLSDKTLRLVPIESRITGSFLALALQSASARRQVRELLNGSSGQQNISQRQIRRIVIALPTLTEQTEIVNGVRIVDGRLASEREYLAKLRGVKQGLMDDLLTGRACVDVSDKVAV